MSRMGHESPWESMKGSNELIPFHNTEPRSREERLAAQSREKLEKNLLKVSEPSRARKLTTTCLKRY